MRIRGALPATNQRGHIAAPHILLEGVSIHSIQLARSTYLERDLNNKLAQYHNDPDSAFWGWNDIR